MDKELRYFLEQGPTTVKELARLTGKSTSTIYKNLKDVEGLVESDSPNGKRFHLVAASPVDGPLASTETSTPETPNDQTAVAPAPSTGVRGRKATAAGQRLFPDASLLGGDEPQTYQNPRRKDSHGYRSLQIIIDNPGITTEEFIAKGGRLNDLRWDIAHGNVKVES
jgi:hypothetical protein